jgi:CheY-like chemotaxis protein
LSKILSGIGFDLVEAVNGLDACEKWRETRPDLILMDQNMPVMNGTEATRAILEECRPEQRPVIIAVTANAFDQAREAALAAGFHDFIAKPFKKEELLAMIADHLGITYTYKQVRHHQVAV